VFEAIDNDLCKEDEQKSRQGEGIHLGPIPKRNTEEYAAELEPLQQRKRRKERIREKEKKERKNSEKKHLEYSDLEKERDE
tara:strand:+ start:216 stop:458 length:243 start_codon:yes stop_codon:yes gene_type:complete